MAVRWFFDCLDHPWRDPWFRCTRLVAIHRLNDKVQLAFGHSRRNATWLNLFLDSHNFTTVLHTTICLDMLWLTNSRRRFEIYFDPITSSVYTNFMLSNHVCKYCFCFLEFLSDWVQRICGIRTYPLPRVNKYMDGNILVDFSSVILESRNFIWNCITYYFDAVINRHEYQIN